MCVSMICGYNSESEHDDSDSEPTSKWTHKNIIGICFGKYIHVLLCILLVLYRL